MTYLTEWLRFSDADRLVRFDLVDGVGANAETLKKEYIELEDPYCIRVRKLCYPGSEGITDEDRKEAIEATWRKLNLFFRKTTPVYDALLNYYATQKDKLMDGLTTSRTYEDENTSTASDTSSRGESETPVSSTFDDFPSTDGLTFGEQSKSNSTGSGTSSGTSTTKADHSYAMTKLDEITRKYINLYSRWYNEFYKEFAVVEAEVYAR